MSLIAISNPYTNHSLHIGEIPDLRADANGRLGKSPPITAG
jgi:hypothetical protein